MTELLPCPFCGSSDVLPDGGINADALDLDDRRIPQCQECGAMALTIEDWNTRTPPRREPQRAEGEP